MNKYFNAGAFAAAIGFSAFAAPAFAFEPASVFNDNMVLQRDEPLVFWGRGEPGEKFNLSFAGTTKKVKVGRDGTWQAKLKPLNAGGPYQLKLADGDNTKIVNNIMVGDVWLCSGQSNMAFRIKDATGDQPWGGEDAPERIRIMTVERDYDAASEAELAKKAEWQPATTANLAEFSAVCAYLGEEMEKELDVPVGLINSSWGGSQIEAWISAKELKKVGGFDNDLMLLSTFVDNPKLAQQQYADQWQIWWQQQTQPWKTPLTQTWFDVQEPANWQTWKGFEDFNGLVWYRNNFNLTEAEAKLGGKLSIGGIDEVDLTWLNGQIVGTEFGWGTERTYDVEPGVLKAGENLLMINITSTYGAGGLVGPADHIALTLSDGKRIALGEGWQASRVQESYGYPRNAPWQSINGLSGLYNSMIAPLKGLKIRGVAWYQGESNTGRAGEYADLMQALIRNWREDFGKNLPFVVVQLPGYGNTGASSAMESDWAQLRLGQWQAVANDKNAGLVIAIDQGDPADIHPKNKSIVGKRTADVTLALMGEKAAITDGIYPVKAETNDGDVVVTFDPAGETLQVKGSSKLNYVELCADSCKRVNATVLGGQLRVALSQMTNATRVRYCWADAPECHLYGQSGLPVSSFEIDIKP
ncbi:sialate O-acetylesterase [Gynuella sunshinyii]|uniref:Sialate O-acetylesterase domain-containing protein n=1 Tax=Gynuella sunshinyii YC6258 TaxID=1445510 RepID=A0A0C5VHR9_9GAMM|nr:sialate O-acetylesterase [Gynuella sunshinyii]AJQ94202.1 hypothetical Protein YC6258_02164 [Gynuella sunshinyii YC6258]